MNAGLGGFSRIEGEKSAGIRRIRADPRALSRRGEQTTCFPSPLPRRTPAGVGGPPGFHLPPGPYNGRRSGVSSGA